MAFGKKKTNETVTINAPNFKIATLTIRGTAPLVLNRFSTRMDVEAAMTSGKSKAARKDDRPAKDFAKEFQGARHLSPDGWDGVNASGFRNALIRACQTVGIEMTRAKMAVFVVADGNNKDDGTPLVRIWSKQEPEEFRAAVRNKNGSMDVRARPMWREWECKLRVRYDADLVSSSSVANLVARAGEQVGVGAGRPFSTMSAGQGWGTFEVVTNDEEAA